MSTAHRGFNKVDRVRGWQGRGKGVAKGDFRPEIKSPPEARGEIPEPGIFPKPNLKCDESSEYVTAAARQHIHEVACYPTEGTLMGI